MNLKYRLLCEALGISDDPVGQDIIAEPEEDDSSDKVLPVYMKTDVQPEAPENIGYAGTPVVFSDRPHGETNRKQAF